MTRYYSMMHNTFARYNASNPLFNSSFRESPKSYYHYCYVSLEDVFLGKLIDTKVTFPENNKQIYEIKIPVEKGIKNNSRLVYENFENTRRTVIVIIKYNEHHCYERIGDNVIHFLKVTDFKKDKTYKITFDLLSGNKKIFTIFNPTVFTEIIEKNLGFFNRKLKCYGDFIIKFY